VTLILFGAGLLFGLWIGQEKVDALTQTTLDLESSIDNAELQFAMLDILEPEIACNYLIKSANELGKESDKLALEVERYENAQKISEKEFSALKKQYTSTIIRNWITLEKIKETCEGEYTTLLYFYSNEQCNDCESQGIILTDMKDELSEDIMIFALDAHLNMMIVNTLRDSYNIYSYPSIVIDNEKYSGLVSIEELTDILCEQNEKLEIC